MPCLISSTAICEICKSQKPDLWNFYFEQGSDQEAACVGKTQEELVK